jgi:hypothetical protein
MAVAIPGAHASASYTTHGGCFFDTNSQATATNGAYIGIIGDRSVTTTVATPPTPVSGTVSCKIQVNGADASGTEHSYSDANGSGVQAGGDQIAFTAADEDVVTLCQKTVYAGGAETDDWDCAESMHVQIPPQVVYDTLDDLFINTIDPAVCPILKANAGTYGPITIEADDGDVYGPDPLDLGLNPYDDCPVYGDPRS